MPIPCRPTRTEFKALLRFWGIAVWVSLFAMAARAQDPRPADLKAFADNVSPLVSDYCLDCHSTDTQKGDLDLEQFTTAAAVLKNPKSWELVAEKLASGEMPPEKKPQPSPDERQRLLDAVNQLLDTAALAHAGDPGPVVLRRLNNAEYTYTIRDLTGVDSLDPAKEFPGDSASGEGFMNVGNSLVMSPSLLTKYFDAAKGVAAHAVLLPDGIRFSPSTSRRDWTEELLTQIRDIYHEYADQGVRTSVNLQGIKFDSKDGGVLPLDKYLAATLKLRELGSAAVNQNAFDSAASSENLSPKYLGILWNTLTATNSSFLLDPIRGQWRAAKTEDVESLAKEISRWQHALWKFNTVGHIGKKGGPKSWMEAVTPVQAQEELRLKIPSDLDHDLTLYLATSDAGDGTNGDNVIVEEPRLVAPGKPTILLRDLRALHHELVARRERVLSKTADYLAAASEVEAGSTNLTELAHEHGLDPDAFAAWLDYLGLSVSAPVKIESHFTNTFTNGSGYAFINGWGPANTPNFVANSSDQHVRIPGNMKPHSIALHPSPTLDAAVGWQSPVSGHFRIQAVIQHAHPECGNGVTWSLEFRHGSQRRRLASGLGEGDKIVKVPPVENLSIRAGDLISVLIGPRDGNHSCDLTAVDLTLMQLDGDGREWDLAKDVSPDVLAGNPHADRFGNAGIWHFYTEPDKGGPLPPSVPVGSVLAKWQLSEGADAKAKLAAEVQKLLTAPSADKTASPDVNLNRQLTALGGPLFGNGPGSSRREEAPKTPTEISLVTSTTTDQVGLDPERFGKRPDGSAIDSKSLSVGAPSVIEIHLPADLVAGYEFVAGGRLDPTTGAEGSVQLVLSTNPPAAETGLVAISTTTQDAGASWASAKRATSHETPIIANDGSAARKRIESELDEFRQLFPAALCYTKIVPVDEVITLRLFHREDEPLERLMLNDAEASRLDRLWDELRYVSQDALKLVDVFEQLWQYATQDADPSVFEPMREPIKRNAAAFRQRLIDTQPAHLDAVLKFAGRAYRRPLKDAERNQLRDLYQKLRDEELPHEDAIRLVLARVLVSPPFLYRLEEPPAGDQPGPVNDWELATRLSYFLWSSAPDEELLAVAASGKLHNPDVLVAQMRRMLNDPRVRRLATEFGCTWLHVYDFASLDEKSEKTFPDFNALRGAMYEETIRFFTDLFQNDRSVLDIVDADYAWVDKDLAKFYGISLAGRATLPRSQDQIDVLARQEPRPTGADADDWYRVDGAKKYSRGGVLALAATLAKQSGASRTSPILRGNWVAETLLGEKLPRPPKGVPQLPEEEATQTLTVRELTLRHSTDPKCYGCHRRIDPYGYALEAFDGIGRFRDKDLGGRPIDTHSKVMDGTELDGLDGLRHYLLNDRRKTFLRQFCRKLLGYSLGREVMLSDSPLINEMRDQLQKHDYHITAALETIVRSRQFRDIRGRDMAAE
ncbi:DUF1592 domain-containing protein [bacterium]|nr:DUF1592 domain-containing protein [bacterium]